MIILAEPLSSWTSQFAHFIKYCCQSFCLTPTQDIYLLVREGVDVDAIERNTEVCDVRAVPLLELRDQWLGGDPSYVPHARRYLERVFATLVDRFAS